MESDEEILQVCAAIVVADDFLEKRKRKRKKWVNDYLLKRTTKGSYGGLLTELSLENEIFKEYLRRIPSISVSSEILCNESVFSISVYIRDTVYYRDTEYLSQL